MQKLWLDDETERRRKMDLGIVRLMTSMEAPIIYYGDERYLAYYNDGSNTSPVYVNSGDDDPWNRPGC
jgi:glycosidase